jgi:hypothetical protein
VGSNVAGLQGATFVLTAVFENTPYVDDGTGEPALLATESKMVVSGATVAGTDGTYPIVSPLLMFPNLGGLMRTPSNPQPLHYELPGLRFGPNLPEITGGNGSGVNIGDMPQLSHFGSTIPIPVMRVLPHNVVYEISDPSFSVVDTQAVPEPSAIIAWLMFGVLGISKLIRDR